MKKLTGLLLANVLAFVFLGAAFAQSGNMQFNDLATFQIIAPDDSFCVWVQKVEGERHGKDYGDIAMSVTAEFSQRGTLQKLYSINKNDSDQYSFERNSDGLINLITYSGNPDSVRKVRYYYDSARVSRIENVYVDGNGKETPGLTIKRTYDSIAYVNKDSVFNFTDSVYYADGTLWTTVKCSDSRKYYIDKNSSTIRELCGARALSRYLTSEGLGLDHEYFSRSAFGYLTPHIYFSSDTVTAMMDYEPMLPDVEERIYDTSDRGSSNLHSSEFDDETFSYNLWRLVAGTAAYSFSSSNEDVATIAADNGHVTLKGAGTTVITINLAANGYRTASSGSFVLNVVPFAVTGSTDTVTVDEPGGLKLALVDLESTSVGSLTIKGKLNGADLKILAEHSGRLASLQELDMSEVTLVPDGVCYASQWYGMSGYDFYLSDGDSVKVGVVSNPMFAETGRSYSYYTMDLGGMFGDYRGYGQNTDALTTLKHITLPKNTTGIGPVMFENCKGLVRVNVPESCTKVGVRAFYGCGQLKADNLKQLKEIGSEAFINTTDRLGDIDLSHVTSMGDDAFEFSGICKADLSSLDTIPNEAFYGCDSLSSVTFSPTLKVISTRAFSKDSRLTSVTLPETVTTIGSDAFGKTSIAEINAPSSLLYVDSYCLDGTPWLSAQTAVDGVIYFGNVALKAENSSVTSVSFREGTVSIASGFANRNNIASVSFPSTLRCIGDYAFGNTKLTEVSVPESVDSIGENAFRDNESLTKATLPQSLQYIGGYAFSGCTSLSQIDLPQSLLGIGKYAFNGCTSLSQIDLPQSLLSIGDEAFRGCTSLKQIDLPQSLLSIDYGAFINSGIGSITVPENVTYLGQEAFNTDALVRATLNARHADGSWAFSGCKSLEKVTIGPNVEYLQPGMFSGCENLLKVDFSGRAIPADSAASADSVSFAQTTPLVISKQAFWRCDSWTPVIPFGTTYIGTQAFTYCPTSSITELWLPYGLETVEEYTIEDWNIEKLSIPPTMKDMASDAYTLFTEDLRTVYDYMTEPYVTSEGRGLWLGTRDSVTLYVMPGLLEDYKAVGADASGSNHYYYSYYNHNKQQWNYKAVLEMASGVPTAVKGVPAVDGNGSQPVYYDLQGRRVANPHHGIYIVNGRKVVIR